MANDVFLSVIIPSYNETENLKHGALNEVAAYLENQKYSWEVIVSDDGSPEAESRELASSYCQDHRNFSFLENKHAGKPFAIWSAIQKAKGKIVLFTDMDQSTPISEVEKLLAKFDKGFEVVIGSRGTERKNFSLFRLVASSAFRTFRRTILLPKIIDTQAGFKSLTRESALKIFPKMRVIRTGPVQTQGWKVGAWDVEMLFIADKLGYKIAEVPVAWANRDVSTGKKSGGSKFVHESLEMLQEIIRVRINDLKGYYR